MAVSLRLGLPAALVLCLAACEHAATVSGPQPIWVADEGRTLVHNPSGIRVRQQAGRFHLTKRFTGEMQDLVVLYAAGSERGGVRVYFSGLRPESINEPCETIVSRRADRIEHRAEFTQRLGPWTDLAPLFDGMEAGRAAIYDSKPELTAAGLPMRSEIYILCGTAGSWIVEYRADYPRDGQGADWIGELIAATAPPL